MLQDNGRRSGAPFITPFVLAILVAAGFVLRAWGVGFGLPILSNLYVRPDESLIVEPALHLFERLGDPRFYVYPALVSEVTAILYHVYYWVVNPFRDVPSSSLVSDFARFQDAYFLIPRWISVLCGTATIVVVFKIGRRLTSETGALVAAGLFACAPLAVRDAHFGVTDTPMVLFLSLCALYFLRYQEHGDTRVLVFSSALFGLAAASKYTALLMGPRIALADLVKVGFSGSWRTRLKHLAIVALVPLGLFFLLNPYIIPNFRAAFSELVSILKIFYLWQEGDPPWSIGLSLGRILRPLQFGPGELLGLGLAAAGVVFTFAVPRGRKAAVFLSGFVLLHLLALVPFQHPVPFRYLLPILPFLAVLAGKGFADLFDSLDRRLTKTILSILLVVSFSGAAARSVRLDGLLSKPDTRVLAGEWIRENAGPDTPIVLLCGPESEPQVLESPESLKRRMKYVARRYGENAGDFISRLYRDQLANPEIESRGREVYRFPQPEDIRRSRVVRVTSWHPLELGNSPAGEPSKWQGRILKQADFVSTTGAESATWDIIDGFFLPFDSLAEVERPGPNLRVEVLELKREVANAPQKP